MCEAAGELVPNEDEEVLRLAQNARENMRSKMLWFTAVSGG